MFLETGEEEKLENSEMKSRCLILFYLFVMFRFSDFLLSFLIRHLICREFRWSIF